MTLQQMLPASTIPALPNSERSTFRRDVAAMTVAWTLYNACQFSILAILARLGSPEAVGRFVLAMAITAPIMMFAGLQLRVALATDERREFQFIEYLALRILMSVAALISIVAIIGFADYDRPTQCTILVVALAKAIELFSDLCYGWLQANNAMMLVARAMLIKGPLTLLSCYVIFRWTGGVAEVCLAMAISWLAVLLMHDIPTICRCRRSPCQVKVRPFRPAQLSPYRLASLAVTALPLGAATGLLSLEANIPRYIIELHLGQGELGIFGALVSLALVVQPVMNAVCQSAVSRLAALHSMRDHESLRRLLRAMVNINVGLGLTTIVIILLSGPTIVTFVFGVEFADEYWAMVLLTSAAAVSLLNAVFMTTLRSMRRFRAVLWIQIASTLLTAAACWFLAKPYELAGIGAGMLSVAAITATLLAAVLRRCLQQVQAAPMPRTALAA